MRVLVIGKFYYPHPGGIERYVYDLVKCLSRAKTISTLDCLAISEKKQNEILNLEKGVLYKAAKVFTIFSTPITPYFFSFLYKNKKYDLLHVHLPNPIAVLALLFCRPKGSIVLQFHALTTNYPFLDCIFFNLFVKRLCNISSKIIFNSNNIHKNHSFFDKYTNKIEYVSICIDTEYWVSRKDTEDVLSLTEKKMTKVALFVGRATHYKGLDYLIQASEHINGKIIVIGNWEHSEYKKKNLYFVGKVSDLKLKAYYYLSDVVVLPSTSSSETLGLVQIEAMACGKPVVVTDLKNSAIQEPIKKGGCGVIVKPKSAYSLAKGVNHALQMVSNPKAKVLISRINRDFVKSNYEIKGKVNDILDIYSRIV